MWKKIILAVLIVAVLAASVFSVVAYRFQASLKPEITEENLAENAAVNDAAHALTGTAPFSAWKAQAGDAAEIDFGKEVTFNTVTLTEARDKTAYAEEAGFGGVMIFRAKCDAPYTYEYAIHRGIEEAIEA